jgi:hypothetical protein
MLNRKLLEILIRFDATEHKRFRQFILSPYFTYGRSSNEIVRLYDYIMEYGARENDPALDKRVASAYIFPDKSFLEKGKNPIDTLTSDLVRLIRQFLFQQEAERRMNEAREGLPLARFYRTFGLEERFLQTIQSIQQAMDNASSGDEHYYLDRYFLEVEIHSFKALYNSNEDDVNLSVALRYLDNFFAISRLNISCALQFQNRMADLPDQSVFDLTNLLLNLMKENKFHQEPLAKIYAAAFNLICDPYNNDALLAFELMLKENKGYIGFDQYASLLTYHRAIVTANYRKHGSEVYLNKLLDLSLEHLKGGYLYIDGKITTPALRLITMLLLRLNRFEEAKQFLDAHPPETIGGTRFPVESYEMNYAEYHFFMKEYDAALNKLNYRLFENVNYSIQADVLLIKIYFETQDELLEPRSKALLQKVRRSGIAPDKKEMYLNFLKKLTKIVKFGWDKRSDKKAALIEEIKETGVIIEREWLLRQIK